MALIAQIHARIKNNNKTNDEKNNLLKYWLGELKIKYFRKNW